MKDTADEVITLRETERVTVQWVALSANQQRSQCREDAVIDQAQAKLQINYQQWKIAALEAENAVLKEQVRKMMQEESGRLCANSCSSVTEGKQTKATEG